MDMPGSLGLDKKAARTSPNTFVKQSFTDDGRVPVGGDLPHGHAHCFRLDPTLSGAREGLVGAYGRLWGVGDVAEQWLHTPSGRLRILGGGCQSCVCALAVSLNNVQG